MSVSLTGKARIGSALLVVCIAILALTSTVAAQVTLYPNASPTSAQPGVQVVTLTGFGFPDGNIHPTDVKVKLTPVSGGTATQATALQVTRITGSTVKIYFTVPSALSVTAATAYTVDISGVTYDGVKFSSTSSSSLSITPASSVTLSPAEGESGSTLWVDVLGTATNFTQGATYARFGAGATVGSGALGDYGLLTVSSPTSARALVTIDPSAAPGSRTVVVLTGSQQATASFNVTTAHQPPVADPGPQQLVNPGDTVQLDGGRSTSPSGAPLQYQWSFVSVPSGSKAALSNNFLVNPTFVADVAGDYVIQLSVSDGTASTQASVTITSQNTAPVANAGPDQSVNPGTIVQLNGSASSDTDGDQLTFAWTFKSKPQGSAATLDNANSVTPTFLVDAMGSYVLQLTVNDGHGNSSLATVTISTSNQAPVADAGSGQTVAVGSLARLDGSRSSDPDNDPLSYSWTLISRPVGSNASLIDPLSITPSFSVDTAGAYVAQLTVNDQHGHTSSATVTVSTINSPPLADAGAAQSVSVGDTVYLSGAASSDPDHDSLTYTWSLVVKPAGSKATLTSTNTVNSSFVADVAGDFVAQLVVGDPTSKSAPSTVLVTVRAAKSALDPQVLNFGDQALSTTSASRPVVITNTSNGPITLSGVSISGPDANQFQATAPAMPMTVAPGDNTTVNVTFTPASRGARSAALVVNQGASTLQSVQLAGNGVASPSISYTPGALPFGDQTVGTTSAPMQVIISNPGSADLVISSLTLTGPDPGDFGFNSGDLPITVAPGGGTTITFTFTPTAAGARSALILITDNASGSPHSLTMSGKGLSPVFGVSPTSVTFADQAINTTSTPSIVTLKNTGTAPMTINSISIDGTNNAEFGFTSSSLPIMIPAGGTSLVSITFTPTATGSRTATLTVNDNAGGPHTVPLGGNGITLPAISVLTSTVDFGSVEVGKNASMPVQVKNTGSANLVISAANISGLASADYSASSNTFPITIAPGATGNVNITFTPGAVGGRPATVTLSHNATGVASATLTGTGTSPSVTLGASSLDLGKQLINTTSPAKTVSVKNSGTANLVINSLTITGVQASDFATSTTTPITVAPGNTVNISITFKPSATGTRTATLSINDDASGSPHTVTLTGTGTAPGITVNPSAAAFGNQRIGTTSTAIPVTITNSGTADLTVSQLKIDGTNASDFILSAPTLPITVTPTASVTLNITYKPAAKGASSATLTITHNAGTPNTVTLSGTGVTGDTTVKFNPLTLDLGTVKVGVKSAAKSIVISNTGSAVLSITKIEVAGANASEFAFTSSPLPLNISPAGFTTVAVSFTPQGVGTRTATLVFTDNAEGSPQSVALTGNGQGAPLIDLPASTNFGNQNVGGASTPKNVVVGNKGTDDLVITSVTFTGTNSTDFTSSATLPITVPANTTANIPVTFKPSNTGTRTASIRIVSNSAGSPSLSALTGVGTQPVFQGSPTTVDFGSRAITTTSPASAITVKNNGTGPLTISTLSLSGANVSDFAFSAPTLPIVIQAGNQVTVNVTFTPSVVGNRTATLNFADDALGHPHTISLKGTGAPNGPAVSVSPTSLSYGDQPLSAPPVTKSVTITNTGNQDLSITQISITGASAGDFTPTFGTLPIKVAANATTVIQVAFKPSTTGSRVANLSITHNAPNSPTLVSLSGNGTKPGISVAPNPLDFGTVQAGQISTAKTIVVTNTGTAPLTISSLTKSGAAAANYTVSSPTLPATVAPGGTFNISVQVTPQLGDNPATLTIAHNAPGGPITVTLKATGGSVGATNMNYTSAIDFGQVDITKTASKPVVISNTGGANLIISSLTLSGPNANEFTIASATLPITVAPSGSVVVNVIFSPKDVGLRSGLLTIGDNATGSPHQVTLTGTGIINGPAIRFIPTSVTFPDQMKNTASQPIPILITNPGNQDLSISALRFSGTQASEFNYSPTTLPLIVPKNGGQKTISVIFTPADFGPRSASLIITNNSPTSNVAVPLSGNGTGPIISFTPSAPPLNFGSQPALTVSDAKQLVITNIGTGNLTITNLNIPIPQFTLDTVQLPIVLSAGQSTTLNVHFAPTLNQTYTSALTISDNANGAPHTFGLTGVGVASSMSFMPADKLDFGSVILGNSSSPKPVALVNSGTVVLVVTNVAIGGANPGDYTMSPLTLPATVDPGKNLPVTITFKPGAKGTRSASLIVTNNTTSSPQTYALTGSGAGPVLSLSTNSINFGQQINGTTSTPAADLVLNNTGDAPLVISGMTLGGTNPADFGKTAALPLTINPGQNAHVPVTFSPSTSGNRSATLTITYNAGESPATVNLSGIGVPPPIITPTPGSLTFPTQLLNSASAPKSITITNTGGSALIISGFTLTGANPGDFAITSGTLPLSINQGASATINVTFTPAGPPVAPTTRTAAISIASNVPGSPATIALTGTAIGEAKLVFGTNPLAFGSQMVGLASAPTPVVINNPGTADLQITNIGISGNNPGDFTVPNAGLPISVPAGTSKSVNVVFTPATVGPRAGTITFTDNGTGSPHQLQVSGTGVQPAIKLTPNNGVTFGTQLVGVASVPQTLTITNTGTADLTISALTLGGAQASEFAFTQALPVTIPANNGSLVLSITFTPQALGVRTASLTITHNAPGGPVSATLTGTGTKPNITLTPNTGSKDFGEIIVGNSSTPPYTITIGNTGTGPLNIQSIGLTGQNPGDFVLSTPTLPTSVQPGSSIPITATFKPTANGARAATISIVSNNDGSPHTFALTGTGKTIAKVQLSATSITFPNQLVGTTSDPMTLTVTNSGSADLVISALNLTGTQSSEFLPQTPSQLPLTIAPGANAQISITFTPASKSPTSRVATLAVVSNASTSPDNVNLSGTAYGVPKISIPATTDFGGQRVSTAGSPVPITISNTGSDNLNITTITVSGANASDFTIPAGLVPTSVAPGNSLIVNVTFKPAALGTRTASLNINDNAQGSPHSIALTGTGTNPIIATVPASSLSFGDQLVMVTSTPVKLTIQNTGTADLVISAINTAGNNPGDFNFAAVSLPLTIAPGQSQDLSLTFRPAALGARSGFINITHNAAGSVLSVALSGNGTQPIFNSDPGGSNGLQFGTWAVGGTTAAKNITVSNTGTGPLVISALQFIGTNPTDFAVSQDVLNALPLTIQPNQSSPIPVTFSPTGMGTRSATLRITDNAPGSPHTVGMLGSGVQGNLVITTVPVSNPPVVNFGSQAVNNASAAKVITLQNNGSVDVNITALSFTGANAGDFALSPAPTLPIKIASNSSTTLSLVFTPTAQGTRSATLKLTHDAQGPDHVDLGGTGTQPVISVQATDFGKQAVGNTFQGTVNVANTGNGDLVITALSVSGTNASDFTPNTSLPLTIQPGKNGAISVNFNPAVEGPRTATLSITHNAPGSPTPVTISGTGVTPLFSVNAPSLTFANQNVGEASPQQTITVTNTGNGDLVISSIALGGANPGDYQISNAQTPITLTPSATTQVQVVFKPMSGVGPLSASVVFTDNAQGSPHSVTLNGTAVGPTFSPTPTSLDFGSVSTSSSSLLPVTITNNGTGDLNITAIQVTGDPLMVGDFTITAAGLPIHVGPGLKTTVSVTFSPKDLGTRSATLTFTDNAPGNPQSISMTGNATGPKFKGPDTQPVEFGTQAVSTSSQPILIPVKNIGNAPLVISSAKLAGDAAADFILAGVSFPLTIQAGGTYNLTVVFRPKSQSPTDKNANITFIDNAIGSPHQITLHGKVKVDTKFVVPPTVQVGYNMETIGSISINNPAPDGGIAVTITSSDENLVLLSDDTSGLSGGKKSITMTIPKDGTAILPGFYVQGLASSGTATLTFSAQSMTSVSVGVQLIPSGFILAGPAGIGQNFSTVTGGSDSQLGVYAATGIAVDPNTNAISYTSARLRGGYSVIVPLASGNTDVGDINGIANFLGGTTSTGAATFHPKTGGTSVISLTQPTGFTDFSPATSLTATVSTPSIKINAVTVGANLQVKGIGSLDAPAPANGLTVTITSQNTNLVTLSATPNGLPMSSIQLIVPQGSTALPDFYVYGMGATGGTHLTVAAPGFADGGAVVTLQHFGDVAVTPSGFVIEAPGQSAGQPYSTTTISGNSRLTVSVQRLDPNKNPVSDGTLRGGLGTFSVPVTSGNTGVGTISNAPAQFGAGGTTVSNLFFVPKGQGNTNVSVGTPTIAGFSTPNSGGSIAVTVTQPQIQFSLPTSFVGVNLELEASGKLTANATGSSLPITITSNDAGVVISGDKTVLGSTNAIITVPQGQGLDGSGFPAFYIQALPSALGKTVTLTASATGWATATTTVTVTPSGFVLVSPNGVGANFAVLGGLDTPLPVVARQLQAGTFVPQAIQAVRPGLALPPNLFQVTVVDDNPNVGAILDSPAEFNPGDSSVNVHFTSSKANKGSALLHITQPTGFFTPSVGGSLMATVN